MCECKYGGHGESTAKREKCRNKCMMWENLLKWETAEMNELLRGTTYFFFSLVLQRQNGRKDASYVRQLTPQLWSFMTTY